MYFRVLFLVVSVPFILTSSGHQFAARVEMQIFTQLFVPNDAAALSPKIFDDFHARDFEPVLNAIVDTPQVLAQRPQIKARLMPVADVFPIEKPLSVKTVIPATSDPFAHQHRGTT